MDENQRPIYVMMYVILQLSKAFMAGQGTPALSEGGRRYMKTTDTYSCNYAYQAE